MENRRWIEIWEKQKGRREEREGRWDIDVNERTKRFPKGRERETDIGSNSH